MLHSSVVITLENLQNIAIYSTSVIQHLKNSKEMTTDATTTTATFDICVFDQFFWRYSRLG